MNKRRKNLSSFRRGAERGRGFPGHRTPQPTFSQTLRDMSFGDILPGSIEKRLPGNWITPEEAAAAIRKGDGSGVRIAILDSGVEIGHPDFRGRQLDDDLVMDDVNLGEFAEGEGEDTYGHGTAIAGIIWKVAPEVGITSFRVLGPKLAGRTAQVWLAANEAITRGFDIINCGFACGISGHLSLYKEWTDRALLKGVHVVAPSDGEEPEWPAHFASVLAVDFAESEMDEGEISYSAGRMVGFTAATDGEVPWKDGTHRSMTGSSFAAALMTGIVARLLSVYPIRDPLLLKALLRRVYGGEENWN